MRILSFMFFLMFVSSNAAADYFCETTVSRVLIYKDGGVNVLHSGRGDYTVICNLKTEREDVSITTCAMWASMLQNIKKNNGKAIFYCAGTGSCNNLPTYADAPAPIYIGDM